MYFVYLLLVHVMFRSNHSLVVKAVDFERGNEGLILAEIHVRC